MKLATPLLFCALSTAAIVTAVTAAAPKDPEYAGRPVPAILKQLIWQKTCDLPQYDSQVDCALSPCPLVRSDGTRFKPEVAPWQDVTQFEWTAAQNTFGPALVQTKTVASVDDLQGSTRVALELLSGLPLQDPSATEGPLKVNPKLAAWFGRELLPPAEEPMCGKTAADVYALAFRQPTRVAAEVYATLQLKGLLKGVTVDALAQSFDNQKGKYASACQAIAKKSPVPDEAWTRAGNCWWWLRRAATGTAEPMAALLGEVLRRYDAPTWKAVGRAFPKVPKQLP